MPQLDTDNLGQRQTSQRDAIVAVIEASNGPLTVQQIHEEAKKTLNRLGIATVYRNIKLLIESHQIHSIVLPDGQTRYESANLGHHDHFRCRKCDKIFDLPQCPMELPAGLKLPGGFVVQDHELTLYGICPTCSSKKKKSGSKAASGSKSGGQSEGKRASNRKKSDS